MKLKINKDLTGIYFFRNLFFTTLVGLIAFIMSIQNFYNCTIRESLARIFVYDIYTTLYFFLFILLNYLIFEISKMIYDSYREEVSDKVLLLIVLSIIIAFLPIRDLFRWNFSLLFLIIYLRMIKEIHRHTPDLLLENKYLTWIYTPFTKLLNRIKEMGQSIKDYFIGENHFPYKIRMLFKKMIQKLKQVMKVIAHYIVVSYHFIKKYVLICIAFIVKYIQKIMDIITPKIKELSHRISTLIKKYYHQITKTLKQISQKCFEFIKKYILIAYQFIWTRTKKIYHTLKAFLIQYYKKCCSFINNYLSQIKNKRTNKDEKKDHEGL